jgi:hypothetical protein
MSEEILTGTHKWHQGVYANRFASLVNRPNISKDCPSDLTSQLRLFKSHNERTERVALPPNPAMNRNMIICVYVLHPPQAALKTAKKTFEH